MDRTRTAGIVAATGATAGAVFSLMELASPTAVTLATGLRNCLFHLAAIVGLLALATQGAAGRRGAGRVGIAGAVTGFALLCVAELTDPFVPAVAEVLYQACPLILGVSLLVAGVAVWREGRWTGWRRAVPGAAGAYVFVVFLPTVVLLGDDPGLWLALAGWELVFLALGVAVALEARAERPAREARVA